MQVNLMIILINGRVTANLARLGEETNYEWAYKA